MDSDENRADAWYLAISEFLEAHSSEEDAKSPGTLVSALCRVLADAAVGVDDEPRRKVEAIASLTARAMGLNESVVMLKEPSRDVN